MEKQPFKLTVNGEDFELNNRNSMLMTFIGELAVNNCVRLFTDAGEGQIWHDHEMFPEVANYMAQAELPLVMNIPEVPDEVAEANAKRLKGEDDISEEVEKWKRLFEQ